MNAAGDPQAPDSTPELERFERLAAVRDRLLAAIGGAIVGQREAVELLLVALFGRGHALFVGVPGLAKSMLVERAAAALGLDFRRLQFTPDLMPADILGSEVLDLDPAGGYRGLRFVPGPVFTNLLLADEINRTPPKTQAALLQAMQEREVSAMGRTRPLPRPFLVLATQNPIEQEGTYPLPEAQLDRFMLAVRMDYPSLEEELEIVERIPVGERDFARAVEPVLEREELLAFQELVRRLPVNRDVLEHAVALCRASRPQGGAEVARRWLEWGAGPRASQYLLLAARVRAALRGRELPSVEDVRALALPVLAHRLVPNFEAEAEGISREEIVRRLLDEVPPP